MVIIESIRIPKIKPEEIKIQEMTEMFNRIAKAEKKPYKICMMYDYPHLCRVFLGFIPWSISQIYYNDYDDYFEPIQSFDDATYLKIQRILQTMPISWKIKLKQ